jgi:hypothetical protein
VGALAATVVAYIAFQVPTSSVLTIAAWMLFIGPVVVGLGLPGSSKTNNFGAGLLMGAALTWVIAVPACVLVGSATYTLEG